jgi:hypothetical protein
MYSRQKETNTTTNKSLDVDVIATKKSFEQGIQGGQFTISLDNNELVLRTPPSIHKIKLIMNQSTSKMKKVNEPGAHRALPYFNMEWRHSQNHYHFTLSVLCLRAYK